MFVELIVAIGLRWLGGGSYQELPVSSLRDFVAAGAVEVEFF